MMLANFKPKHLRQSGNLVVECWHSGRHMNRDSYGLKKSPVFRIQQSGSPIYGITSSKLEIIAQKFVI